MTNIYFIYDHKAAILIAKRILDNAANQQRRTNAAPTVDEIVKGLLCYHAALDASGSQYRSQQWWMQRINKAMPIVK